MRTRLTIPVLALCGLMAAPLWAQDSGRPKGMDPTGGPDPEIGEPIRGPRAYGAGTTIYGVIGNAMPPLVSTTTYDFAANLNRFRTGPGGPGITPFWFHAPVTIPSGALMTFFELEACDTNATEEVSAFLHRCPTGGGACSTIASISSGAAPGCATFVDTTITTPTMDNDGFHYDISVAVTGNTSTTSLGAVRIGWRRQVRPGPATATFTDVPTTSIFFQFVEALAAAGITGGCTTTPGGYCPAEPVTRAQMAAFLSIALGLHWPN